MSFAYQLSFPQKNKRPSREIRLLLEKQIYQKKSVSKSEPKTPPCIKPQKSRFDFSKPKYCINQIYQPKIKFNGADDELFALYIDKETKIIFNPQLKRQSNSAHEASYQENKIQQRDSFSSYLLKNKRTISRRRSKIKNHLRYFDLNQFADQLASPKKLESKLNYEQQTLLIKQNRLEGVPKDYNMLNDLSKIKNQKMRPLSISPTKSKICVKAVTEYVRTEEKRIRKNSSCNQNYKSTYNDHYLWKEEISLRQEMLNQKIVPWRQNEEQYSPLRAKKHQSSELGYYDHFNHLDFNVK